MNQTSIVQTIAVGGAAGDGIREAGLHLGVLLHKLGYQSFLSFDYPSLIRGGHNFSRLSFSKEKVWCDHTTLDVLIAVNAESVRLHQKELTKDSVIFVEESHANDLKDIPGSIIPIPLAPIAGELKARPVARTTVAIGAFCFIAGLSMERMMPLIKEVFEDVGGDLNLALAEKGYHFAMEKALPKWDGGQNEEPPKEGLEIIDANKAVGKGFLEAGMELYISYPMTPATSILHFLAKEAAVRENFKTIQPEDEISAANMAIGSAYAGKRTATGTATGGFALMQEAFSFAGVSEIPFVVAVSQRQGPATGVPTNTSQSDLLFILHSGHGEFPRIVIAPGDSEEAYYEGARALELSWKYQMPAIVLLDKQISESTQTSLLDPQKIIHSPTKLWVNNGEEYKRYQFTEDGISPMAFPGTPGASVKTTSYEHDEIGIGNDIPENVQAMHEKRFKKTKLLSEELGEYERVKIYGDKTSDAVIIFWGSTKGAVLEAAKYINKPIKFIQVLWMDPFDSEKVESELQNAKLIIDVEANQTGQLASLIREKTGIQVDHKILRHDSKPFDPLELAETINGIL